MNTIGAMVLPLLLLASARLYPETPRIIVERLNDRHITPFAFLPKTLPNDFSLGKKTSGQTESTAVTKIDLYMWRDSQWKAHWIYNVLYDKYGRVAEYYRDPFFDGMSTSSARTIFEYHSEYRTIREIEYTTGVSQTSGTEKSEACTDYYLGRGTYPGVYYQSTLALPYSNLVITEPPKFDSISMYFSLWDRELNAMTSSELYQQYFTYEDSAILISNGYRAAANDTFRTSTNYKLTYHVNQNGLIDTVRHYSTTESPAYQLVKLFTYTYADRNLVATTHREYSGTKLTTIFYYDLVYSSDNRIQSYTEQYTSDLTPSRTNISKVVYNYSTIPITSATAVPRGNFSPDIHAGLERNHLRINVPSGTKIVGVTLFDLRGCRVKTFTFAGGRSSLEVLPVPATNAGLRIVQVRTDHGDVNLSVRSVSGRH